MTSRTARLSNIRGHRRWLKLLLIGPPALWFLFFFVIPLIMMITVSFWDYQLFQVKPDLTLENYTRILSSSAYLTALTNTFRYAIFTVLLSLLIGYPVAYFLSFVVQNPRARLGLLLICFIPFWTSYLIRALAWLSIFGRKGLINQVLMSLGLIAEPTEIFLFSELSIIIAMTQIYVLFMIAPIVLSLHDISRSLLEAARDSGASATRVFKEIVFPMSLPGVVVGTILVFVMSMGDFATVQIVGGFKHGTLATWIQSWAESYNYPMAAANGLVLILSVIIGVWLMFRVMDIRREL